jgi:hypothetical protein
LGSDSFFIEKQAPQKASMIRWNSGADSIVWIEEGKTTRPMQVSVLIHAPKTIFVFGFFLGCDSRIRLRSGLSLRPET